MARQQRPGGPRSTWEPRVVPTAPPTGTAAEHPLPPEPAPHAAPDPARATVHRPAAPERVAPAGIGETVARYVRGEGAATVAHLRALGTVRSPGDLIRLQAGEVRRAADASLTCWSAVAREAVRAIARR